MYSSNNLAYTGNPNRTIASLTNDDSKILGNLKPKLKKLQEQNTIQTNKLKTLNSTWTPLVTKHSNHSIFEERTNLVSHWVSFFFYLFVLILQK
jgi:hypothetical protein